MLIQLIIIQIVTFVAIVLVLRGFLYTETAKEANRLRMLKEEYNSKQRELQKRIEAAENIYRDKLMKAEEEIRISRLKAEDEIEKMRKEIIDKAKAESERILKAAVNSKEKIREEIAIEMQKEAPLLATRIFKEFLSDRVKELIHKELVEKLIIEVKRLERSRFDLNIKKGELIWAYPVEREKKDELFSIISEKIGYGVTFDEKEQKELLSGIVVKLGTLIIDGSLSNRLKEFAG